MAHCRGASAIALARRLERPVSKVVTHLSFLTNQFLRYKQAKKASLQAVADEEAARLPSPPDAPPPALPIEQLATTFSQPAYGSLSFLITAPGTLSSGTNWTGPLATSLTLQHYTGNLFNASVTTHVPVLDQDEPLQYTQSGLHAEFEVDQGVVKGFGLWGGVWGSGFGVEPLKGTSARELAEVWFDHDAPSLQDEYFSNQKALNQG